MAFTQVQQKKLLAGTLTVLVLLVLYRAMTGEKPRTAPLVYTRGAVATSSVRPGMQSPAAGTDPLRLLLVKHSEKFPGVSRDIFRMANPAPKPKPKPAPLLPVAPPPPPVPVKTPEEIAADAARADLSRFRFLGYLTDKDSTLFLSKDGQLYLVRSGEKVLNNYVVKEAGKDHVVLLDTVTHVEMRIELSGSDQSPTQQRPR